MWKVGDKFQIKCPDKNPNTFGQICEIIKVGAPGHYNIKHPNGEVTAWVDEGDMGEVDKCDHPKIPTHLKPYYHQLVQYYCQVYPDISHAKNVLYKKPCCLLAWAHEKEEDERIERNLTKNIHSQGYYPRNLGGS